MLKPLGDGAPVAAARAAAPPTTAIAVFRVDVLFVMDGLMGCVGIIIGALHFDALMSFRQLLKSHRRQRHNTTQTKAAKAAPPR